VRLVLPLKNYSSASSFFLRCDMFLVLFHLKKHNPLVLQPQMYLLYKPSDNDFDEHFHLVRTICEKALPKPLHLEWWEAFKFELNLFGVFTIINYIKFILYAQTMNALPVYYCKS
jgi:hypothetical protein